MKFLLEDYVCKKEIMNIDSIMDLLHYYMIESDDELEEIYERKVLSHGKKYADIHKELTKLLGRWWKRNSDYDIYSTYFSFNCDWQNHRFPGPYSNSLLNKVRWMQIRDALEKTSFTESEARRMLKKYMKKVKNSRIFNLIQERRSAIQAE